MSRPVLTAKQAAKYCGISYGHLRNLISAGDGPEMYKQGRLSAFYEEDLDAWNDSRLVKVERAA